MKRRVLKLREVRLDFERERSVSWWGIALAIAGAIAAAAAVQSYSDAVQNVSVWEAKLGELKRMARRMPGSIVERPRDPAELRTEIQLANGVLQQMTLPWERLFHELERSRDQDVSLLSIEPDVHNRLVRIGGEAKTLRAAIEYSRRLEKTGVLYNVYLAGHGTKTQDPQHPVAFALVAGWR